MSERFSDYELDLVSQLSRTGLDRPTSTAAVAVATRAYSRPRDDLVATLTAYPELDERITCEQAVDNLTDIGFLELVNVDGTDIIETNKDIRKLIQERVGKPGTAKKILSFTRTNDHYVSIIGPLRDSVAYTSYLSLLATAKDQILMPHIMTDPQSLGSIDILKERAAAGVDVRILGASASLAQKLRGSSRGAESDARIQRWKEISKAEENIEYRITESPDDLIFASSILIDRSLLRLIIHDPYFERSKEGLVVQFSSGDARHLNIISAFESRFHEAWRDGRRPSILGYLFWLIRNYWQISLGVLFAFIAAYVSATTPDNQGGAMAGNVREVILAISASLSASLLLTGSIELGKRSKRRRSRRNQSRGRTA